MRSLFPSPAHCSVLAAASLLLVIPAVPAAAQEPLPTCFGLAPTLVVDDELISETPATSFGRPLIVGTDSDDVIVVTTPIPVTVLGGAGQDTICGGSGNDRINGQHGEDQIDGGLGDDYIIGGPDDDVLRSFIGAGTIRGNGGSDHIILGGTASPVAAYGGVGADGFTVSDETSGLLFGNKGTDTFDVTGNFTGSIRAGKHADVLAIEATNIGDIYTGTGHDSVVMAAAPENLWLGPGNDTARVSGSDNPGRPTMIDAGTGRATMQISGPSTDMILQFDGPTFVELFSDHVGLSLLLSGADDRVTVTSNLDGYTLVGNGGDDVLTIVGDGDGHTLVGGAGTDTLEVRGAGTGHTIVD